jgi:HlyD family secretion protein
MAESHSARQKEQEPEASGQQRASRPVTRIVRADQRKRLWAGRARRVLLWLLALAGAGAVVFAWLPKPVPVDLAKVERTKLTVTIDEDGRTRVKDRYVVSAPLLATVARIELRPGDAVEPGTVLARLLPLEPPLLDARTKAQAQGRVASASAARWQAHATVDRVRTGLELAQREAERQRSLTGSGAVAARAVEQSELEARSRREELASAEFGARVADYELRTAEAALGRIGKPRGKEQEQIDVVSPVKGRVLKVIQQSEGAVQPGTPLLEIGDPAALEIVVDVLTSDAVHVKPGAEVFIERWGGEHALRAHVRLIEPSAFTRVSALGVEEQRVNVVIDLDEPQQTWASLGDGYHVEARIVSWSGDGVLSVPASATFRREQGWAVFRVVDDTAQLVPITLGHANSEHVEVLHGLSAGERVIVHPSDRVEHDTRVEQR